MNKNLSRGTARIGRVRLGKRPCVVLVVDRDTATLAKAAGQGVQMLEARVDRFEKGGTPDVVREVKALNRYGLPLIGTVRSSSQGGARSITPRRRSELYNRILPWVDAVDIETASRSVVKAVVGNVRKSGKTLILSYHNFKRTPSNGELERRLREARSLSADITKIAVSARGGGDVLRMYDFTLKHRAERIVTLCMGPKGSISRILFATAGSLLTYTSPIPFDGQIPLKQLVQSLRLLYPKLDRPR